MIDSALPDIKQTRSAVPKEKEKKEDHFNGILEKVKLRMWFELSNNIPIYDLERGNLFTWVKVSCFWHFDTGFCVLLQLTNGFTTDANDGTSCHTWDENFEVVHSIIASSCVNKI